MKRVSVFLTDDGAGTQGGKRAFAELGLATDGRDSQMTAKNA